MSDFHPVAPEPEVPAPKLRKSRAPAPSGPLRFSGPHLIGCPEPRPHVGAVVVVSGSMHNDGRYTVTAADADWLTVSPHVLDEPTGRAVLEIAA